MSDPAYNYSSITLEVQLASGVDGDDLVISVDATTGFPPAPFNLTLDPSEENEEIVTVTEVNGLALTVLRGQNGTVGQSHGVGAKVRHQIIGRDLQLSRNHEAAETNAHGIADGDDFVGRLAAQTLEGKTIDGGDNTLANIPQASVTGLVAEQAEQFDRLDDAEDRLDALGPLRPVAVGDTTTVDPIISTTPQDSGTFLVFTAPPSGRVTISWWDFLFIHVNTTASRSFNSKTQVRTGAVPGGGTIVFPSTNSRRALVNCRDVNPNSVGAMVSYQFGNPETPLTPGAQYHVRILHDVNDTSGITAIRSVQRRISVRPEA